jgi:hypothetical protein
MMRDSWAPAGWPGIPWNRKEVDLKFLKSPL